ncbi:MAG: DNA methyltransferase [Gemmatimonadaceae bacterium]
MNALSNHAEASTADRLKAFVEYWRGLAGDEKGEAQVFCDRLFRAFGHAGYKEAGATLEHRVKRKGVSTGTQFADLVWKPRVLIEMKKRGERLQLHFRQAFDYWVNLVPNRPRYVVLCNFDEFWIYDFDKQIDQPVDVVRIEELPRRHLALSFLFPENPDPLFGNDREAVTREAAERIAEVFRSLVAKGEDRERAQRFVLQMVVAMFAEDVGLMPAGTMSRIVKDCFAGASSFDLMGGLFRQMNSTTPASAGRFKGVPYFNGGLFATIDPIDLGVTELTAIGEAADTDWARINPAVFGTLFQSSMDAERRHALGAHFTAERDIMKVITPTVSRPWEARIAGAKTLKELSRIREELLAFRVLDPACGSGNFLYLAFRELIRLEIVLLLRMQSLVTPAVFKKQVQTLSLVSPRQFFGFDIDPFAVELAKVTLVFGKKLALDEVHDALDRAQIDLDLQGDHALPLENLDDNLRREDALFAEWPTIHAIIGNPPFQSKNKMQVELGRAYVNRVRKRYPDVPGRADYCVYWFRRAHDELKLGQRAGLVGTNTIRQNYSREGGLDHIVRTGGTITDAVSTQVWSGDAAVHVSIVNWVKGESDGPKRLMRQVGDAEDSPWEATAPKSINSALSFETDVTDVEVLRANAESGNCYQGQTHGHEGFLMPRKEAEAHLASHPRDKAVLFPFLIANELIGAEDSLPTRYVIDFGTRDLLAAQTHKELFARVERLVLPAKLAKASAESLRNTEAASADAADAGGKHHSQALRAWWLLFWSRQELMREISSLPRYIACGRVTKRPIFEFISPAIHPNDALMVFPFDDDYSFGILQSGAHWQWFVQRCSTMKGDFRYTSNTVFDTFPWPQAPTARAVRAVADAARELRALRASLREQHGLSLRELYRAAEKPGKHPLNDAQARLDLAVREAYGFSAKKDILAALAGLNAECATREARGEAITGPGFPLGEKVKPGFVSTDCVRMP